MGSLNAGSAMFPCQRVLQVQSTKEVQCNKPTLAWNIKMGHSHAWKCMGLTSAGGQVRGLSQVPSTEARPLPDNSPVAIFLFLQNFAEYCVTGCVLTPKNVSEFSFTENFAEFSSSEYIKTGDADGYCENT